MDGLKPAYYTDPEELLGDFNNDGIIQSAAQQAGGGDQFSKVLFWLPMEMENGILNHLRITTEMESMTGMSIWI